jgi:hypothetical protein
MAKVITAKSSKGTTKAKAKAKVADKSPAKPQVKPVVKPAGKSDAPKIDVSSAPLKALAGLPQFKAGGRLKALVTQKDYGIKAGEEVTVKAVGLVKNREMLFLTTKSGRKTAMPLEFFVKRKPAAPSNGAGVTLTKMKEKPKAVEPVEPVYVGEAPPKGWKKAKSAELIGKFVRLFRIDATDGTNGDWEACKAHLGLTGKVMPLVADDPKKITNSVLVKFSTGRIVTCLLEELHPAPAPRK